MGLRRLSSAFRCNCSYSAFLPLPVTALTLSFPSPSGPAQWLVSPGLFTPFLLRPVQTLRLSPHREQCPHAPCSLMSRACIAPGLPTRREHVRRSTGAVSSPSDLSDMLDSSPVCILGSAGALQPGAYGSAVLHSTTGWATSRQPPSRAPHTRR
ncbi:hypothetical protein OBBRIDRAFT_545397 [Obba rivulosa]|uniref:Uncharacterized protein n=1 Tax=Obba rivulosa TaxID=1052685 RepID=A0A8E2AV41_9APHY|nr:hypothetical protein OBBRIDRAFT_545397 [Obba rivulosa]